ncbi:nuclear transport factor 2 family protein [Micrococcaceae bacterium Sec5.7]
MDDVPVSVADRWVSALSRHDLDAAADCFTIDYADEAPARRGESVHGRAAARRNFQRLFADVPDLTATILRAVQDGTDVWMEGRMEGRRRDGSRMEFVGVNIFEVENGQFRSGRIYTELVRDAGGIDAQIDRMAAGST